MSPRTILFVGWIAFVLGCYPGYLSGDSVLQLYTVRSGDFTDYSPVMTALWSALEYVTAGPFPMLALQSGLFLFGLDAILRKLLVPRAAAVTASCVLLFPPVFAVMAVIWPESLMAGALLAGFGAALDDRRGWKIVGAVSIAIAIACRPEVALAVIPLAFTIVPASRWWRRTAIALGVTIGLAFVACVADRALTVVDTYAWQQHLMVMDTVGVVRRAKVDSPAALEAAFAGLPLADRATLRARVKSANDAFGWSPLSNGEKRIFDLVTTDEQASALAADWRHSIAQHPKAYALHRWAMTRALLRGKARVYDSFGGFELLKPLHHRASPSDYEVGMQHVVRLVAKTPLFMPWLYLALAIAALVLAWRRPIVRAIAASGLVYELSMFVLAPTGDYRYSHWLVSATCIAIVALAVARRPAWRLPTSKIAVTTTTTTSQIE